jgi:hypothetical protein
MTVDHAKRVFSRALKKLDTSQGHDPTLGGMIVHLLKQEPLQTNSQPSRNAWFSADASEQLVSMANPGPK